MDKQDGCLACFATGFRSKLQPQIQRKLRVAVKEADAYGGGVEDGETYEEVYKVWKTGILDYRVLTR